MTNTCLQLSWQLMHSSVIYHGFFLCCVCTHTPIQTHTRKQCVPERDSSFCFFYLFFLPCGLLFLLSLLLWLSSLASDTRKLKLLFHLESVAKRFTVTPLLPFSLSPVVWFLCHFYAHYFAFAACLSLALCFQFTITTTTTKTMAMSHSIVVVVLLWAYFDFYSFVVVLHCRRSRFHCLQSPCRIFITLCTSIMMSSNAADNLWSTKAPCEQGGRAHSKWSSH